MDKMIERRNEMKPLEEYSRDWRRGRACAYQARCYENYDPLGDDPIHFLHLAEEERNQLHSWIKESIKPRKTMNLKHSSYGLKHIYEHDTGNYVTNGQFKGAMITAGYTPNDAAALNPSYAIRECIVNGQ